jgi:hypothetical protein
MDYPRPAFSEIFPKNGGGVCSHEPLEDGVDDGDSGGSFRKLG